MTYKVFSGTLNPTQSVSLCVLDMALYKHCIYSLFVLSCVTDCFTVHVCCHCGQSMA